MARCTFPESVTARPNAPRIIARRVPVLQLFPFFNRPRRVSCGILCIFEPKSTQDPCSIWLLSVEMLEKKQMTNGPGRRRRGRMIGATPARTRDSIIV